MKGGSGRNLLESFAALDQDSSLWKMSPDYLAEVSGKSSQTFPRSGMMRSGQLFQQPSLAARIKEIDYGLWPTPTSSDGTGGPGTSEKRQGGMNLRTAVTIWPTPAASEVRQGYQRRPAGASGNKPHQKSLTTRVVDAEREAQKIWPTPRASEWKGTGPIGSSSHQHRLSRKYLDATVQDAEQITGQLNPNWVDWLMGLPVGYTDCGHSATASCPKSRK